MTMRIETFTNRRGEQRYRVINGKCVYDCGGLGYKTYESAQQGFYYEITKLRKAQLSARWYAYKKTDQGKRFIDYIKGKKLSYKLIEEAFVKIGNGLQITVMKQYNLIKEETNKESCYT